MGLKVYINGTLYEKEDAKISVFDHGLLYGDGVFEGIRSYSGKVFRLAEHLDRLWESAAAIGLTVPGDKDTMAQAVVDTLAANSIEDGYIRLVITRGAGTLGLDPDRTSNPQIIIITDHIALYPEEFYENGLPIITATTRRTNASALSPQIKSLNYLNNILAKIEGMKRGVIETLMLNADGQVAECTGDNIFVVLDGVLVTPPVEAGILKGITRAAVMELATASGVEVREQMLDLETVYGAAEVFLTGTAAEVVPVIKIDDRQIADGKPGPISRDLISRYRKLVNS